MRIAASARSGVNTSFYGKKHTDEAKAKMALKNRINVNITDLQTKQIQRKCRSFKIFKYRRIRRYKKTKKLYLDRYLIENS